jgi:hypothetical protein
MSLMSKNNIEENYAIKNKESLDKISDLLKCSKELGNSLVE